LTSDMKSDPPFHASCVFEAGANEIALLDMMEGAKYSNDLLLEQIKHAYIVPGCVLLVIFMRSAFPPISQGVCTKH
jgi:hypothetical protein